MTNNQSDNKINSFQNTLRTTQYVKDRLQSGLNTFINHESFGGVLLFFCVVLAMVVANSKYGDLYFNFLKLEFGAFIGAGLVSINVLHFVNDVLMALFFLMVGLEMKREVLYGELAGFKKVSFSILGAVGGIVIPVIIYLYFNHDTPSAHGFGVAMSTDTAFALGVLLIFGKRIPHILKIFLVTLAVFDDLGAILIIAILYTNTLDLFWLYIACVLTCALFYLNYRDTKYLSSYLLLGIFLWIAVYNSGVHATIAGVILAFAIPGRSNIRKKYFINILNMLEEWNKIVESEKKSNLYTKDEKPKYFLMSLIQGIITFFAPDEKKKIDIEETSKQVHMLDTMAKYSLYAQNPLVKMEIVLQPICAYFIVPIFAFLNAGVRLDSSVDFGIDGILLGTILGLVVGKPLGVLVFAFLGEKLNIAIRPPGLSYKHIFAVGVIAGIGFTMSMFVANLAYDTEGQIILAKLSILMASAIAILLGIVALFYATKNEAKELKKSKNIKEESSGESIDSTTNI
ncbi:Na+/H+ antiporter NhaA [Helicobacter sp. 16-1353]|uniref:Na+/H+ antiporter NhaA n=1 Tax=Helicobacter sp. 16-1353 TaxID=2004996 RepID=UPI000DCE133E|nr:Na+/H+ antiporter NhaA [Helicobacter sp. 16-1353]RAX54006.1 Na+/H+ antiporter NhaA [Helicobacter sp. 16-1353]